MTILVTGVSGFAARHLVPLLFHLEPKRKLVGFYRSQKPNWLSRHQLILEKVDLLDRKKLFHAIQKYRPHQVYHLASVVGVGRLQADPAPAFESNILGTANLFEALKPLSRRTRILNVGSAEEYGRVAQRNLPVRENQPLGPFTAYGVSKKCQEEIARYYERSSGFEIVYTRTFHYAGTAQPRGFFFSDCSAQILKLGRKQYGKMLVGNLSAKRDYTDIRDVVSAYHLLMKHGKAGEVYNVSSGHVLSMKQYLEMMIQESGVQVELKVDPSKVRRVDVPMFVGNNRKLMREIGWKPTISIRQMIRDILKCRMNQV